MNNQPVSIDIIRKIGELAPDGYLVYDLQQNTVTYSNSAMADILDIPNSTTQFLKTSILQINVCSS